MMSPTTFAELKKFLAELPADSYIYGHAVMCTNVDGVYKPIGTFHISNYDNETEESKPVDYFISGETIEGVHYSSISEMQIVCSKESAMFTAKP